jgi:hypothetical protein
MERELFIYLEHIKAFLTPLSLILWNRKKKFQVASPIGTIFVFIFFYDALVGRKTVLWEHI